MQGGPSEPALLREGYYLDNFHTLLDHVEARYADLFASAERAFLADFRALDLAAQRLWVRLISRRGPCFRVDRLSYPEIGALADPIARLDAIRDLSRANNADPIFSKTRIGGADSANDRAVGTRIGTADLKAPLPGAPLEQVRGEVERRLGGASDRPTQAATFDARNEIVRNPDGTISTRRSQLVGNARQLREDAAALAENAKALLDGGSDSAVRAAAEAKVRQAGSERVQAIEATREVPAMLPKGGRRQ